MTLLKELDWPKYFYFSSLIHAHIIGYLKQEMPALFGKQAKQQELLDTLPNVFAKVQSMYRLPPGDFPDIIRFRENLKLWKFQDFAKLNDRLIRVLDEVYCVLF